MTWLSRRARGAPRGSRAGHAAVGAAGGSPFSQDHGRRVEHPRGRPSRPQGLIGQGRRGAARPRQQAAPRDRLRVRTARAAGCGRPPDSAVRGRNAAAQEPRSPNGSGRRHAVPVDRRPLLVLPGYPTAHGQELRRLAAELGVAGDVRFPGWVDASELEGLYAAAACFVFPSLIEGFGLPVLEAMARGLPVACSGSGSLAEVAGDAALRFDPGVRVCDRRRDRSSAQRSRGSRPPGRRGTRARAAFHLGCHGGRDAGCYEKVAGRPGLFSARGK